MEGLLGNVVMRENLISCTVQTNKARSCLSVQFGAGPGAPTPYMVPSAEVTCNAGCKWSPPLPGKQWHAKGTHS